MKDVGGIPIVLSRGTPYEIGYNHGKSHPDKVRKSFEHNLVSCLKSGYVSKEEGVPNCRWLYQKCRSVQ